MKIFSQSMKRAIGFIVISLLSCSLFAQVELPALFSDNMVLQQKFENPIWGWASPGETIKAKGSWDNITRNTSAGQDGKWQLQLYTPKAGGPYFISINDDTLHNVMIGEVWICSGQSNMQWALDQTMNHEEEIPKADYPAIRFFYLARQLSDEPQKDCHAYWTDCNPETAKDFSAVAYYFGRKLHAELDVPVGLIHTSWGGSSAQAWVREKILRSDPDYDLYYSRQEEAERKAKRGSLAINQKSPNCLYNAMLAPLIPYGIKGAIWYQGESNVMEAALYEKLFPTMIKNWRDDWGQGDFPFYFVQLAPFDYDTPLVGALLRDAQRKSLDVVNTGMAVTMDIGDPEDIHPVNKHDVGERLALWALAKDYGQTSVKHSGPLFRSMIIDNNKAILIFDHAENGLVLKSSGSTGFEIAGTDRRFYPANVEISGNSVIASAKEVKAPVAVRYAFHNGDEATLFNAEGIPASSFRTDDWLILTVPVSISSSFDQEKDAFIIGLQAQDGYEIYYTLDGTEPDKNSNLYQHPFLLRNSAEIKARAYQEETPSIVISAFGIIRHLATGKKATYKNQYANRYAAGGNWALVNSIKGSDNFHDGNWQGIRGKDLEVVIDLGEKIPVNSLSAGFLQDQGSWILFPEKVEYYGSNNGSDFRKLGEVINDLPQSTKGSVIREFTLADIRAKYRYIKVFAPKLLLPDWHPGAGNEAWLFADEIVVE